MRVPYIYHSESLCEVLREISYKTRLRDARGRKAQDDLQVFIADFCEKYERTKTDEDKKKSKKKPPEKPEA